MLFGKKRYDRNTANYRGKTLVQREVSEKEAIFSLGGKFKVLSDWKAFMVNDNMKKIPVELALHQTGAISYAYQEYYENMWDKTHRLEYQPTSYEELWIVRSAADFRALVQGFQKYQKLSVSPAQVLEERFRNNHDKGMALWQFSFDEFANPAIDPNEERPAMFSSLCAGDCRYHWSWIIVIDCDHLTGQTSFNLLPGQLAAVHLQEYVMRTVYRSDVIERENECEIFIPNMKHTLIVKREDYRTDPKNSAIAYVRMKADAESYQGRNKEDNQLYRIYPWKCHYNMVDMMPKPYHEVFKDIPNTKAVDKNGKNMNQIWIEVYEYMNKIQKKKGATGSYNYFLPKTWINNGIGPIEGRTWQKIEGPVKGYRLEVPRQMIRKRIAHDGSEQYELGYCEERSVMAPNTLLDIKRFINGVPQGMLTPEELNDFFGKGDTADIVCVRTIDLERGYLLVHDDHYSNLTLRVMIGKEYQRPCGRGVTMISMPPAMKIQGVSAKGKRVTFFAGDLRRFYLARLKELIR